MFKEIADLAMTRAYTVEHLLNHAAFARPPRPSRRRLRRAAAWLCRRGGQGLLWAGERLALPGEAGRSGASYQAPSR